MTQDKADFGTRDEGAAIRVSSSGDTVAGTLVPTAWESNIERHRPAHNLALAAYAFGESVSEVGGFFRP